MHVPLIISCPSRFQQNVICDALVELVDIALTILKQLEKKSCFISAGKKFIFYFDRENILASP